MPTEGNRSIEPPRFEPDYEGEGFLFCIGARYVPFLSYWWCSFWGLAGW